MIKRFLLAFIFCILSASPALADGPFGGFFPDPTAGQADNDFQYLGIGSASSILNNERLLVLDSNDFLITDNGAGANYAVSLKTVPVTKGGTGQTSIQAAINSFLNGIAGPSAADGQIIYRNTGGDWTRLATDTDGKVLTMASGLPVWSTAGSGAPANAEYLVVSLNGTLTNERRLQGAPNKITLTDGGANGDMTLNVGSDIVQLTSSQTLTNKTLTGPVFSWNSGNGYSLAGQSFTSSIRWADWPAARVITIPDPGTTNADFLLTQGAQTKAGVLTLSAAPVLSTNTLTAGANLMTFPGSAQTLVGRTDAVTLTNKELTAPSISSASTLTLKQSTANYVLDWANPGAGRQIHLRDPNGNADIALLGDAETHAAGAPVYSNGNTLKIGAAGSTGQPLISQGTGAPIFAASLAQGFGGTGITSYTAGDILVVNDSGNLAKLAGGTDGHVLTYDSTGNPNAKWAAATGGGISWITPAKTGNFSAVAGEGYSVSTSGGAVVCTLPTAVGVAGKEIFVDLDVAGNNLTFNTTSSQTMSGIASGAFVISTAKDCVRFISNNVNWIIQ